MSKSPTTLPDLFAAIAAAGGTNPPLKRVQTIEGKHHYWLDDEDRLVQNWLGEAACFEAWMRVMAASSIEAVCMRKDCPGPFVVEFVNQDCLRLVGEATSPTIAAGCAYLDELERHPP